MKIRTSYSAPDKGTRQIYQEKRNNKEEEAVMREKCQSSGF